MDFTKLKIAQLREELSKLDLPTKGLKKDLVQRLQEHYAQQTNPDEEKNEPLISDNLTTTSQRNDDIKKEESSLIDKEAPSVSGPALVESKHVPAKRQLDTTNDFATKIMKQSSPKEHQISSDLQVDYDDVDEIHPFSIPADESKTISVVRSPVPVVRAPSPTPGIPLSSDHALSVSSKVTEEPHVKVETDTLHIENLQRPYTNQQLVQYLEGCTSQTTSLQNFWLNFNKSNCFATFKSPTETMDVQQAINEKIWPAVTGKPLRATFVTEQSAINAIKEDSAAGVYALGAFASIARKPSPKDMPYIDIPNLSPSTDFTPNQQEVIVDTHSREVAHKMEISLDDIFKKTKADPAIYYLPLTDAQVEEKRMGSAGTRYKLRSGGNNPPNY